MNEHPALAASRWTDQPAADPAPTQGTWRAVPRALDVLDSASLFRGRNEVHIAHGDAIYRLRRTSLGKLILTK